MRGKTKNDITILQRIFAAANYIFLILLHFVQCVFEKTLKRFEQYILMRKFIFVIFETFQIKWNISINFLSWIPNNKIVQNYVSVKHAQSMVSLCIYFREYIIDFDERKTSLAYFW